MIRTHRDLEVWKKSIELCAVVYAATRSFPASERFGLTSQIRRAAISISSNIAEGAARGSARDFVRFLYMARGSLAELETQLEIARRCEISDCQAEVNVQARVVGRMLNGLIRSLQR
jgi:four helix bundle protein